MPVDPRTPVRAPHQRGGLPFPGLEAAAAAVRGARTVTGAVFSAAAAIER